MKYIDKNGVPFHNQSTKYELVTEDGKKYPPKYVIAVAAHIGNNVEITTDGFNAVEPKNYLQVQGYNIETKQEKFELTITADSVDSTDERFTMDNLKTTPTIWSNDEGGQMVALLKLGENEHNICII